MYVRMLTGRYKGLIREASPEAARAMLADGRAEREYPVVHGAAPVAATPASEPGETAGSAPAVQAAAQNPTPAPQRRRGRRR